MIQSKFCCDKLVLMFVLLFLKVRSGKVVWFVASNQEKTNTYISASLTFYNMKHLPLQSTSFGEHCNNYQRREQVSVFTNIWQCVLHIIIIIMICFIWRVPWWYIFLITSLPLDIKQLNSWNTIEGNKVG